MTAKERVLTIRLLDKIRKQSGYAAKIGLSAGPDKTPAGAKRKGMKKDRLITKKKVS